MADKITDKQNATTDFNGNYVKRNFSSERAPQPMFGTANFPSREVQQPMFGMTNFSSEEITQPNFNLQNQDIDRELEAINRMTAQSIKAKQDIDREKLQKINSINSLAAQLSPEEKTKYSKDKTNFSWLYRSLPSANKIDNYSLKKLDIIFSQVSHDYNGTDEKQDGIIGDFRQGNTGDCWFLTETKLVSRTPEGAEIIKKSIKNNNNGTFTVTFKGAPDKNYSVTEEEIRKSKDKLSEGDKDVRILEIAADKWRLETQGKSIDKAGSSLEANFLLTGQKNDYVYYSRSKDISQRTITNDKNIGKSKYKTITKSVEPIEALQTIPEGQLLHLNFSEITATDEEFKTQNGDRVYTKHAYYIERKGNEIFLHDPHNTAKPAIRMNISECANREFLFDGSNLNFIQRKKEEAHKKEEGFFTRMLNGMNQDSVS